MKDYTTLAEFSDKQLRTLRNNLNNRLSSFKNGEKTIKPLPPSHMLHGMEEAQCKELLGRVVLEIKKRN